MEPISIITNLCIPKDKMKIEATPLKDCFIIHNHYHGDQRGYFVESYNQQAFEIATGLQINFVQDNQSLSQKGVLRGLHFQQGEYAQAKLVRVLKGKVLDVVVDLRKNSPSYAKHFSVELSEDSHTQLFVPKGFAHGFVVLSTDAIFFYKVDQYYHKAADAGICYNDPAFSIDWQLSNSELILSEKDKSLPTLAEIEASLTF